MSVRSIQSSAIAPRTVQGDMLTITPWVRNPSWLALTPVGASEQAFRGLIAVFPDSSFTAFTVSGAYTVDWGDGTSNNYTSGSTALKQYDFNSANLNGTNAPVTLTDTGDLVERSNHGYTDGMEVRFYNIVTTTGLSAGQVYYVVNATANSFQVASSVGGTPIALTENGSATLLPYKQAIVTITPQSGQNITALNLNVRHTQTGLQAYETGWLDIELGSPNFTTTGLVIAGNSTTENVRLSVCERVAVRNFGGLTDLSYRFRSMRSLREIILANTAAVTSMTSMFENCSSLQSVPLFNTAAATAINSMFRGCLRLESVPLFNTGAATTTSSMFNGCSSLQTVPLFNTAAVANMSQMFNGCSSLQSVPFFNTAAVTSMQAMFNGCSSLKTVPLFNTAAVTDMSQMFQSCSSLKTVPLFNTAAVKNMFSMFNGCSSLQTVPLFNTDAVTNMNAMFFNCPNLQTVPLFNTAAVTNMTTMFSGCSNLQSIPLFNTAAVTNMNSMFNGCSSLQTIPALITTAVTSSTNLNLIFLTCPSLSRIEAKDFRFSFSVANCKLSATALNEIYTNLPTVTGQTITVSNNWGTASDDPTIATAKGWTVTG